MSTQILRTEQLRAAMTQKAVSKETLCSLCDQADDDDGRMMPQRGNEIREGDAEGQARRASRPDAASARRVSSASKWRTRSMKSWLNAAMPCFRVFAS